MTIDQWASEDKLTEALAELTFKCEELQIDLLLIGAFAVRAYAERRRLTTDLDFVAPRSDRGNLAMLFKSLGYAYEDRTRFGGLRAVKYVGDAKVQLDVDIDLIRDASTDSVYPIPEASFHQKVKVEVVPLEGGPGAEGYILPLADLLVLKLMTGRDQDAADAITLVLTDLSPETIANFKRNVRETGLVGRINTRLGELVSLGDRAIRNLMSGYTGGQLTGQELRTLRRVLRRLRI